MTKAVMPESERILIVDDVPENVAMVSGILSRAGYRLNVALNAEQAIRLAQTTAPDLILLDIIMPGQNGFNVCRIIKDSLTVSDIPIIFLSGMDDTDTVVEGLMMGAADFVSKPFNPDILLARVRTHLALSQKTRQLQEMAEKDGLTQIANRRHFDDYLLHQWHSLSERKSSLALILFDVDQFKAYNDSYGHLDGDDVLRRIALEIASHVPGDKQLAARYGGEEFVILLVAKDLNSALKLARQIRSAVEQLQIPHAKGVGGVVTLSAGVAALTPSSENSSESLIRQADVKLYQAKQNGRNQVIG
ncbi:MAG: diguanylate cyclase [gamma proteobacterium symbiont of Bathyaustriella thionipta]|nr:diguanylate cyclase [gamma proteobacterium symbiont of Bathyaustriella thionipta]